MARRHHHVGGLYTAADAPPTRLLLAEGRPLSYLRTPEHSLVRALITGGAAAIGLRTPVALRGDLAGLATHFREIDIPETFPALMVEGSEERIAFLTPQQVEAVTQTRLAVGAPGERRIARSGVLVHRVFDPGTLPVGWRTNPFPYQYRSGLCSLATVAEDDAVLIWPNGNRTPEDRGEYIACVTPEYAYALGSPQYVAVANAADPGKYAAALLRVDPTLITSTAGNPLLEEGRVREVVALDRGIREALGINDGELGVVHPWHTPNLSRRFHRLGFSARSVYAHPSLPVRADLDKPVCRLSADGMSAIGARDGDRVVIEALVRNREDGGFERRTVTKRVLTIDPAEAEQRAKWASPDAEEGYVDCAEFHGIFPAFPAVYVDYFDIKQLFAGSGGPLVCPVVQVRPRLSARFADDASDFAWVGVIGLVAVLVEAADLELRSLLVFAVVIAVSLVLLRVWRAIR